MTVEIGSRLGPYEIQSPLGAGGMGEVYRAHDTRLDRDVAVKVLPASIAADPEALARFDHEAKAVAALSHPNILAIHDFGTHEGVAYAVMELLEGETLRARLDAGPISRTQAVGYSLQVAIGQLRVKGLLRSTPASIRCARTRGSRSSSRARNDTLRRHPSRSLSATDRRGACSRRSENAKAALA
jgi:serine/threonine protein kinase